MCWSLKLQTACVDVETAAKYTEGLTKIIDELGLLHKRFFIVHKIALYWKKKLSKTFIAKDRGQHLASNLQRNRLTVLLEANATSDFKLKPILICHSESPRALKNYAASTMLVLYKWNNNNKKAWMTTHLFTIWFTELFKPTHHWEQLLRKRILFKILLIDNVPYYAGSLIEKYNQFNVVFIPANTSFSSSWIKNYNFQILRNVFNKAITIINSIALMGLGKYIENLLESIHHSRCY